MPVAGSESEQKAMHGKGMTVHTSVHAGLGRARAAALDPAVGQQHLQALGAHRLARPGTAAHEKEEADLLEPVAR